MPKDANRRGWAKGRGEHSALQASFLLTLPRHLGRAPGAGSGWLLDPRMRARMGCSLLQGSRRMFSPTNDLGEGGCLVRVVPITFCSVEGRMHMPRSLPMSLILLAAMASPFSPSRGPSGTPSSSVRASCSSLSPTRPSVLVSSTSTASWTASGGRRHRYWHPTRSGQTASARCLPRPQARSS